MLINDERMDELVNRAIDAAKRVQPYLSEGERFSEVFKTLFQQFVFNETSYPFRYPSTATGIAVASQE